MKHATSRMTFSSFGGFFAGPARCATAIVREDDSTGPGGVNADTGLLDVTIGAGKKLATAIEQELSRKLKSEILVPIYPLSKRQGCLNSGSVWLPREKSGWLIEEGDEQENFAKSLYQSAPVDGALGWLYGNGLGVLEEIRWLCSHRRAFPAMALRRTLFELSCNARWISAPDSNNRDSDSQARAASYWEWVNAIEQIRSAHPGNEETDRKIKEARKANKGRNSFLTSLKGKADKLKGKIPYTNIYGISSDIVHGDHFWVLPASKEEDMNIIRAESIVSCHEFVQMARATAESCGISDKWPFGEAERRLEEESQR